jgi:hypothetical protein
VELVDVDIAGLQGFQRGAQVGLEISRRMGVRLGRDDDLVALAGKGQAEFPLAVGIATGRIVKIDAAFPRLA